MYVEKAPLVDVQPDEVALPPDKMFAECQDIFRSTLGKMITVIDEVYTTHPDWGDIYRAKYIPKGVDDDHEAIFICWRTAEGIAVSPWNQI